MAIYPTWLLMFLLYDLHHAGLKESAVMSHEDSLLLAEVEDEIRKQVGVVYSQDCQWLHAIC